MRRKQPTDDRPWELVDGEGNTVSRSWERENMRILARHFNTPRAGDEPHGKYRVVDRRKEAGK